MKIELTKDWDSRGIKLVTKTFAIELMFHQLSSWAWEWRIEPEQPLDNIPLYICLPTMSIYLWANVKLNKSA